MLENITNRNDNMEKESKILNKILEWSLCVILAVILAVVIRYYLVAPAKVKQSSMSPTLVEGQRIILNRMDNEYKRGDIVTFEAPSEMNKKIDLITPVAKYSYNPENCFQNIIYNVLELNKISYIKRIIGIPGDRIRIEDGRVYLNGEMLKEVYLKSDIITSQFNYNDIIVPNGYVFVMGDNRSGSVDSRVFGCIPIDRIEGKVSFRYWPLSEFGKID